MPAEQGIKQLSKEQEVAVQDFFHLFPHLKEALLRYLFDNEDKPDKFENESKQLLIPAISYLLNNDPEALSKLLNESDWM